MCDKHSAKHRSNHAGPKTERGTTALVVFFVSIINLPLVIVYLNGLISWVLYAALSFPLHWFYLVAGHDALHRSAHSNPKINRLIGWIYNGFFLLPFPMIRRAHLLHHAKGGSEDDVESFGYRAGWTLPIRLAMGMWCFYRFLPRCKLGVQLQAAALLGAAVLLTILWPIQVIWGWLIPMQVMSITTSFFYIYLPHGKFARWVNQNIPFLTGYHEDHHASPKYPSHQIGKREIRDAVRRIGVAAKEKRAETLVGIQLAT